MKQSTTAKQHRALTIAVIIAIVFGAYFLRPFFSAIVFAAIAAYLFNPIYSRFNKRFKKASTASSLTLLVSVLILLIPVVIILIFTAIQVNNLIDYLQTTASKVSLNQLGQQFLDWINNFISRIPGAHPITVTQLNDAIKKALEAIASGLVGLLAGSVGSISGAFTALFIYIYVFLNLLTNKGYLIDVIKRINPLGPELTDRYLDKMGAMTGAMVRGQFVIAICQGFVEAIILTIAGIHDLFFFLFILLSILSIIPLGGGIIAIPIGIGMLFIGHIWQGLFVLIGHFAIVTNIDNVLRPKLVPKSIQLNPALTLLSVFAGVAMFGFLGVIVGPVIVILIKVTIEAYLEANSPKKSAARTK